LALIEDIRTKTEIEENETDQGKGWQRETGEEEEGGVSVRPEGS